jgi:hypothetical protein
MTGPFVRTYPCPAISEKEILRYAGSGEKTLPPQAEKCLQSLPDGIAGRVVFALYDVTPTPDGLDLGFTVTTSRDLQKNLKGCDRIVLFAATAGVGFDRLVRRYERLSPAAALWYQSIGAAYVEGVCDAFCADLKKEFGGTRPRFSPGYGDLPLTLQKEIFAALQPEKHIGLTLGENLFMTPSKSVTAIVGILRNE